MIQQFAEALRKKIREDLNNLADALATGRARSYEEYKEAVGRVQGLGAAESYLLELLKNVEEDDE